MPIIMFTNLKGGVAKTTNCVAVAECLADAGHRTLVIDADHQCMASELLLGENKMLSAERSKQTLHDMLAAILDDDFESEHVENYVIKNVSNIGGGLENLSLIPCSIRIDDFELNMSKARRGHHSSEEFLQFLKRRRHAVRKFLNQNYDFVLVDCPPSVSMQVRFFLTIADSFIVPCVPDRLSARGSLWLIDRIRRAGIKKIQPLGTLWSLYRQQTSMHTRIINTVAKQIPPYDVLPQPFETVIPNATAIAETTEPDLTPPSFSMKYTSKFAQLYRSLCDEIVQRSTWQAEISEADAPQAFLAGSPQ